ncbi:MAG: hypothetical protein NC089_05240 [Bacteroides sp.]|nr:hypothetical protein [Bacteroides sp.]MCM1549587.1 hypothetical protein [Clostridium sp.]
MNSKTARLFCFIPVAQLVFWLVAFFSYPDRKEISSSLTQGLVLLLCGFIPAVGTVITLVFDIIALVKISQEDADPELPVIGGLNWFDK